IGGRRAFDGGSTVQIMNAILTAEPAPLAQIAAGTPPALARIVHRCLAKDREERYQSARDLAFQLESLPLAGEPAAARAPAGKRPWLAWIALGAAATAAVFAILAYAATRRPADPAAPGSAPAPGSTPGPAPAPAPTSGATPPAEDRHWIQPDDYFISEEPWAEGWIWVLLAKLKRPGPSAKEALFFQLDSSREIWTASYWATHPADPRELALGIMAICFNGNERDGVYHAPSDKDEARTGSWFLGKVTDTSDAAKGWIRIATFNCALDAVRAVGR